MTDPEPITPLHFRPAGAWVGDVIPYAADGRYWLFYLREDRDDPDSGTGWALVSTADFVRYTDHGTVLASGGPDAEDFNCYTGSVVDDGERRHLFYTGQNPAHRTADGTAPRQLVMHATSTTDLLSWERHPAHTFGAPAGYDPADWRDPYVFRARPDEPWRMLLAARHVDGPPRRRGVVAQLRSTDLVTWTVDAPFWDPARFVTQECPDVFRIGAWWYLVYSEFSDAFVTRYRMARDVAGPWLAPEEDTVDGRAFYASKSVDLDGRRFLVGWIATRAGEVDDGPYQWAGTLSTLEVTQRDDGTLGFGLPRELAASFSADVPGCGPGPVRLEAPDAYACRVGPEPLPTEFYARVTVEVGPERADCGVLLRCSADGDTGYVLRLEPRRHRMVFDRWPRRTTGDGQWEISGDVPHAVELERPVRLDPGRHELEVLADATSIVAVVNGAVALSARTYDHGAGRLGVFVTDGSAGFDAVVRRRPPGA